MEVGRIEEECVTGFCGEFMRVRLVAGIEFGRARLVVRAGELIGRV